jgi:tRNA(fMet)-specific endonuclease VapC
MLVLDTDVLSLIQGGTPDGVTVRSRVDLSGQQNSITIVTVEEQFRGRVSYCRRAATPEQYLLAAQLLRSTLTDIYRRTILDFDEGSARVFAALKARKVRVGTSDLRIAAIVVANDAILITRNLSDFRKVPGLRAEDWTR